MTGRSNFVTREHAIAAATNAVRNQGYAVAVHGSRVRDLDLIAIPWKETPLGAQDIAEIIAESIPGKLKTGPDEKPHGRVAFTIHPQTHGFDNWYVDLSVMPRVVDAVADSSTTADLGSAPASKPVSGSMSSGGETL